jgi:hypothetical protein
MILVTDATGLNGKVLLRLLSLFGRRPTSFDEFARRTVAVFQAEAPAPILIDEPVVTLRR